MGGITEALDLPGDLNVVTFTWQNYTIRDEFRIEQDGMLIAGDVGLQSGGNTGMTLVASAASGDTLAVKVTAPNEGTAWDFTVDAIPFDLDVSAKLGDVTKVSVAQLFRDNVGQTFEAVGLDPTTFEFVDTENERGKVAEIDNWQEELKKGVFYFAPKVDGTPLKYGEQHTTDDGLGDSELEIRAMVTDEFGSREIQFPIKFHVTDGFSTSFSDPELRQTIPAVNGSGKSKLDFYRQEQRLAYLGYPGGSDGDPIDVDGVIEDREWAKKVFSIALDPALTGKERGRLPSPKAGTKYFKLHINDADAPAWNDLRSIPGLNFPAAANANQRFWGTETAGETIVGAQLILDALGLSTSLTSTGVAKVSGRGTPSKSHDGGRGIDIDNIPCRYFFVQTGQFVAANEAQGGGFIYENAGGTYQGGGQFNNADHVRNGLKTSELARSTTPGLVSSVDHLLKYCQFEFEVQPLIDGFLAAGSPLIYYNDPRFFTANGPVEFEVPHFNHIHFTVPGVNASGSLQPQSTLPAGIANDLFAQATGRLATATDLGLLDGNQTVTGTLDSVQSELFYRFDIGDAELEGFDTPRDLTVLLNGLTEDADLELIFDPDEDGEGQVLFSSASAGTAAETIEALQLSSGVYYVRAFKQAGDTDFTLSLSLAPLPVPPDAAGDTVATAADLGTLSGSLTRTDFVGEVDAEDLYSFDIAAMSDVDLLLGGLGQADVSLAVGQDTNGDGVLNLDEAIAYSDEDGNDPESLGLLRLPSGNYLVQVLRLSGNSEYELQVVATTSTVPSDNAGNTIGTAADLGTLTSTLSRADFVGDIDPVDFYRFSLDTVQAVAVNLSALSADADVEIVRDSNNNGSIDDGEVLVSANQAGPDAELIELAGLTPGEYFVRVFQYEGDTTYDLSLAIGAASGADLAITRTDAMPSADLGSRFTYRLTATNNGPDTATNVVLTENLPVGFESLQVVPSDPTSSIQFFTGQFVGRIPSLASGASASFDVSASSFISGELLSETVVTADTPDFDLSNNGLLSKNAINSIVAPPADLELTQNASNVEPDLGEQITITLTLTNRGPGTATVVHVRDNLPTGLTYVSSNADQGTYDSSTGIWDVGNVPPNVSVKLRLLAEVVSGTSLINTAEVVAVDEADPDSVPNNNEPTEDDQTSVTITVEPPIEIDVRPGSDENPVNLNSRQIPIAILTTDDFDAMSVDLGTVEFAGASPSHRAFEDVDSDGDLDLIMHFRIQDTALRAIYGDILAEADQIVDGILDAGILARQTVSLSLTAETIEGESLEGFDDVELFLSGKAFREFLDELAMNGRI